MSLSLIEWRELHEIGKKVRRSDPRLAAALGLFALLARSEPMPRHERLSHQARRLRAAALSLAALAGLVIGWAATTIRRNSGRSRRARRS